MLIGLSFLMLVTSQANTQSAPSSNQRDLHEHEQFICSPSIGYFYGWKRGGTTVTRYTDHGNSNVIVEEPVLRIQSISGSSKVLVQGYSEWFEIGPSDLHAIPVDMRALWSALKAKYPQTGDVTGWVDPENNVASTSIVFTNIRKVHKEPGGETLTTFGGPPLQILSTLRQPIKLLRSIKSADFRVIGSAPGRILATDMYKGQNVVEVLEAPTFEIKSRVGLPHSSATPDHISNTGDRVAYTNTWNMCEYSISTGSGIETALGPIGQFPLSISEDCKLAIYWIGPKGFPHGSNYPQPTKCLALYDNGKHVRDYALPGAPLKVGICKGFLAVLLPSGYVRLKQ